MVRYGILGFGLHGDRRLMPGFRRATRSTVTALSRRSRDKARETAARYEIPHAFDSKEALCRCPDVDVVLVTTPNNEHYDDVLLALSCGKPVLCEKPMAMNARQSEEMIRAAREAGLPLGIAQVFRFEVSTRRLRERIAAGQIGRPIFARSEFSYPGRNHPRRWLLDRTMSGGGPIADVGVHCIDALRYILDDEVTHVTALGHADEDSGSVEAASAIALQFQRGVLASVQVSLRAEYRTPIEIVGEEGVLRADNGLTVDHPIRIELWKQGQLVETESVDNAMAYGEQVDAFSDTVAKEVPFPVPGEVGLANQRLLDAAYESIDTGRTIAISAK